MDSQQDQWGHIKPKFLIIQTKGYIVWIDDEIDVMWETTDNQDNKNSDMDMKLNTILNDAATLEANPCDGLPPNLKLHFKRLIGEAIARGLDGDYKNGQKMLVTAKRYLQDRNAETSRFWYLSASIMVTIPCIIFGLILWLFRTEAQIIFGQKAFWLGLSAMAGAIGALLSVILRSGKMSLDCSAGRKLHYLEGTSRILAGAISGSLAALGVQAGFIFASIVNGDRMAPVTMITALMAGMSERFATSIISKAEAKKMDMLPPISKDKNGEESNA